MHLAVDPPTGFVGLQQCRIYGLSLNLKVPAKQDPLETKPYLDQNITSQRDLQMMVEDINDLRQGVDQILLDDSLLPSTSNAVVRSYHRHRKMQKTIYRVRTQAHISQRIAIDIQRDEQAQERLQTITMLHQNRREAI